MRTRSLLLLAPTVLLVACQPTAQEKKVMESLTSSESAVMEDSHDGSLSPEEDRKKDEAMEKDGGMMEKDTSMMQDEPVAMQKGSYVRGMTGEQALAKGHPAVLFFHASWCPTCQKADKDIAALFESASFPMSLYKIDYDTETALKKKYGVTYQHTFVLVTGTGEEVRVIQSASIDQIRELLNS